MADLGGGGGGGVGGLGLHLILGEKRRTEMTEGRKARWASKIELGHLLSSKSGSATVFFFFSVSGERPLNIHDHILYDHYPEKTKHQFFITLTGLTTNNNSLHTVYNPRHPWCH